MVIKNKYIYIYIRERDECCGSIYNGDGPCDDDDDDAHDDRWVSGGGVMWMATPSPLGGGGNSVAALTSPWHASHYCPPFNKVKEG